MIARNRRPPSIRAAVVAASIGACAGLATVMFWGYGPLLALVIAGLTARVFAARGRRRELPWMVVGAGAVPAAILWPALVNRDPAVVYSASTIPALALAGLVLALGIAWVAIEWGRDVRGGVRPSERTTTRR